MIVLYFDDFIESQNVGYFLLKNAILNGKLSHAYLIDTNNFKEAYDFVYSFVKVLVCDWHYTNCDHVECENCYKCKRIDDNNYSEVKIISSDSSVIKKEQLLELQSEFSRYGVEGNNRIYIIKDCDKMNKYASNSLLKFLEEPVDGVIAILVTGHIGKVMSTIVSRCQVIHLNNVFLLDNLSSFDNFASICCSSKRDYEIFVNNDINNNIFDAILNFISYFEENGLDILVFMKKMWYNTIQTREDNLIAFKALIFFYYDVFKYKFSIKKYVFCDNMDLILKVAELNSVDQLVKKLDIIQYGYDMILSNLNINLLLDDVIIKLGDV